MTRERERKRERQTDRQTDRERESTDKAAGFIENDRQMINTFIVLLIVGIKLGTLYYINEADDRFHVFAHC